jgi:hypothetical protein
VRSRRRKGPAYRRSQQVASGAHAPSWLVILREVAGSIVATETQPQAWIPRLRAE